MPILAPDNLSNSTHRALLMTTLRVHYTAIRKGELDIMMVENLTRLRSDANLPATHPLRFHRRTTFKPIHHIHIMDMLLHDVVSAEPVKIIPIPHLILHLRHPLLPLSDPHPARVPINLRRGDLANNTCLYLSESIEIGVLIAALKTAHDLKIFLISHLSRRNNPADSRGINSDRLLHENVLSLLDGILEVVRTETRSRCKNYNLSSINRGTVAIKAIKNSLRRNIHPTLKSLL